jgi:hypothetical protein
VHSCSHCGLTTDRDTAAAMVILNYARGKELASLDEGLSLDFTSKARKPCAEWSSSIDCGSMRQLTWGEEASETHCSKKWLCLVHITQSSPFDDLGSYKNTNKIIGLVPSATRAMNRKQSVMILLVNLINKKLDC